MVMKIVPVIAVDLSIGPFCTEFRRDHFRGDDVCFFDREHFFDDSDRFPIDFDRFPIDFRSISGRFPVEFRSLSGRFVVEPGKKYSR